MRPELLGGPAQQSHGLSLDSRPTTWPASQQETQPSLENVVPGHPDVRAHVHLLRAGVGAGVGETDQSGKEEEIPTHKHRPRSHLPTHTSSWERKKVV